MNYLTVKEVSSKWQVSERRIVALLNQGKILGAIKRGGVWNIPETAKKPDDARYSYAEEVRLKYVVIAGINSDVGEALAKQLVREGYGVIGLFQRGSSLPAGLPRENLRLIEVDYFSTASLIEACRRIKEELAGFVYLEILFEMEDTLNFDYEQFEKSFKVNLFAPNTLTRELVKKMDSSSSIVIVSSIEAYRGSFGASAYSAAQAAKVNLVQSFSNIFTEMYGIRVNSLMTGWIGGYGFDTAFNKTKNRIPMKRLGFPEEVADDIFLLLTRHLYTSGSSLVVDGGYLSVDEQSRSEDMDNARFYRYLLKYISETVRGDKIWAISTLMPNEWNDDPLERRFREENIMAAERGVNVERIFIFDFASQGEFRSNTELVRYAMNKYINSLAVDIKTLEKENPELLAKVDNGNFAINDDKMFLDYPVENGKTRGYITFNKKAIREYRKVYEQLLRYAVPIEEVIRRR